VLYTPCLNYHGSDSFSYAITDIHCATASATVDVTVSPVNDVPIANSDIYTATQGRLLDINSPDILENDIDVDGDPLTSSLITDVNHGTLTLAEDGSFTYDPAIGFNGTDQFTYLVSDGTSNSALVTVSIIVTAIVSNNEYSHPW
jgi:hypothetical protein